MKKKKSKILERLRIERENRRLKLSNNDQPFISKIPEHVLKSENYNINDSL